MSSTGIKLSVHTYGKLEDVCLETDIVDEPGEDEVLLQMLIAPVNPVDINFIEGKYAFRLPLPNVPGSEGVARVIKTGPGINKLKVGDHVIPLRLLGVWKSYIISSEDDWLSVPINLGLVEASMLSINPPTVYRMLKDFVDLNSGDTVIQNGANSACGQIVIQICRIWGINTVNVIRDRPDIDELKAFLIKLGATYVVTESEIRDVDLFNANKIKRPKLALNCVGGQSANNILRHLDVEGTMVTYGGMSKQPLLIPSSALIFKGIDIKGFSIMKSLGSLDESELKIMFNDIIAMYIKGDLRAPPYALVNVKDYKQALANTITPNGLVGKKFLLDFRILSCKM